MLLLLLLAVAKVETLALGRTTPGFAIFPIAFLSSLIGAWSITISSLDLLNGKLALTKYQDHSMNPV